MPYAQWWTYILGTLKLELLWGATSNNRAICNKAQRTWLPLQGPRGLNSGEHGGGWSP